MDEKRSANRFLSRPALLVVGVVVLGALGVMGLRGMRGAPANDGATVVRMTDELTFSPATVRIGAGETVRWTNPSKVVHTATARSVPDGAARFDSGNVAPGASWAHTFEVPGRYRYVCVPHEGAGMVGTVIVE